MTHCDVDHAFYYGEWTSPPDSSIPASTSSQPLRLYVPVHVNNGLTASSNKELYSWFIMQLQKWLTIVDLGQAQLYLGCRIIRNHKLRMIWLSQEAFITELLEDWNMTDISLQSIPIKSQLLEMKPVLPGVLPSISDDELKVKYQSLVESLLYLGLCTRPDIAYVCMALGQHNANPTRMHMLAAKNVLRYLAGIRHLGMSFGRKNESFPNMIQGYIQHSGFSDSDWASDINTR